MATTTREQYLDTAEALFAERGFYGTSIAAIGNELGLTKQALLHHFGSKENLYGSVLNRISARFGDLSDADTESVAEPIAALKTYLLQILASAVKHPYQTRLLMRELLDNNQRAETAGKWFLKPFLEHLISLLQAIPKWQRASEMQALALIYQLLGAINYYAISKPTLTGIFGHASYTTFDAAFPDQFESTLDAVLTTGAP